MVKIGHVLPNPRIFDANFFLEGKKKRKTTTSGGTPRKDCANKYKQNEYKSANYMYSVLLA